MVFRESYIIKNKFHIWEESINIDEIDIKRIVLSKKESYGKKGPLNKGSYRYMYGGTVLPSPLCITFRQISAYIC